MAKPIAPDYNTVFLFPPALEDWVPTDHYVRFVREFVDSLDLPALGFKGSDGSAGRPPFAVSLLLKLWLYGYVNQIFSTRKLERAAQEHLALIWLLGLIQPDHNSIWRFWRDNKQAIRAVFKQSVQLALKVGLVGFALQAVDGTKIEAVASHHTGWTKEWMEEQLQKLNAVLDQTEAQVEAQQSLDLEDPNRLPAELTEKQQLREQIQAGLKELEQTEREHYHRHEPDAHRMQCEGRNRFAYNAQAVADAKTNFITAADVSGQENDVGQLMPMVQAAQATTGQSTACTVGDTHYGAAADLAQADQAGLTVITPLFEGKPKGDNPYHASEFTYQAETDQVVCPQGQTLPLQGEKDRRGVKVKVYRCHCKDCPVRAQCTRDKKGRTIEIGPHHATVVAHREQLKDPANQAKLKQRKVIIEPVFATVKHLLGFRHWTVRGLTNVRAQWFLVCLSVNLLKLWSVWQKGGLPMSG